MRKSAATQSKIAIKLIGQNEELKRLKFRMAILVHDEILAEVPFVTAKKASQLFRSCMLASANDLRTGAACDCEYSLCWYGKSFELEDLTHEKLVELKRELYS